MNYEEMSDFEINQAVTCEVHGCQMWGVNKDGSFYHCGVLGDAYIHQPVVDYCNNPSDAWPIILENKITIFSPNDTHDDSLWMAELDESHMFSANPLRAAMIVFLMMQEASQ